LDRYCVETGDYPKSLQDLVQQPTNETNWQGPYFDPPKLPTDPWGNPYVYEFSGKHKPESYDLYSLGPDGKAGTDDDIGNWQ
jgi:general secretion pathway protein G